jgi:hypothetical protein
LAVCCLLGVVVALAAALIAAGMAVAFCGGIGEALDTKSRAMPGAMLAYVGAMVAALLAGLICGVGCVRTPQPNFRATLLRVVLPGCVLSALSGVASGVAAGALFDRRNPQDESYLEVYSWAVLGSTFIGPTAVWLAWKVTQPR